MFISKLPLNVTGVELTAICYQGLNNIFCCADVASSTGNSLQQNQQQSAVNNSINSNNNNTSGIGITGVGGGGVPGGGGMENPQQMNTLSFCKVGAETVQDIVARTIELFSMLKSLQVGGYDV